MIVYATGFNADEYLCPMAVRGRGGRRSRSCGGQEMAHRAYRDMIPDFPNLCLDLRAEHQPSNG